MKKRKNPQEILVNLPPNHPDRLRWNERYAKEQSNPRFRISPLLDLVRDIGFPDGPVLELACGLSGNALDLAQGGRQVWCVDISDLALSTLKKEAEKCGIAKGINLIQADLLEWIPLEGTFALVFCSLYWDKRLFGRACRALTHRGVLAWKAFTLEERSYKPTFRPDWCLAPGEPVSLLPPDFGVLKQFDCDDGEEATRCIIAAKA